MGSIPCCWFPSVFIENQEFILIASVFEIAFPKEKPIIISHQTRAVGSLFDECFILEILCQDYLNHTQSQCGVRPRTNDNMLISVGTGVG